MERNMTNRRKFLAAVGLAALVLPNAAKSTYLPFMKPSLNALDFGVTGDGSTNDAAALNTFFTTCITKNAVALIPGGKTYNLGGSTLQVPDNSTVFCGVGAKLQRTADTTTPNTNYGTYSAGTGSMIQMGNRCYWNGGQLDNNFATTTSATSNTVSTGGLLTFTVGAGLSLVTGTSFVRIYSRGTPSAKMEGVITSYSGTTLTINPSFKGGSGTFTDWNINYGGVYQNPLTLHSVTETVIEKVRVTGFWYVGLLMDGWNPNGVPGLVCTYCTFNNCFCESVQNRSIYLYGTVNDCTITNCFMDGGLGVTDYTYNANPANAAGTTNNQVRNKVLGCSSIAPAFQGFELGDRCFYCIIANCSVTGATDAASVSYLVQIANTQIPQYNLISNCVAQGGAGTAMLISGNYINVTGFTGISNVTGVSVQQSGGAGGAENNIQDLEISANSGTGVLIGAGCVNTIATGRSAANGTQLTDSGTGSTTTNLKVT